MFIVLAAVISQLWGSSNTLYAFPGSYASLGAGLDLDSLEDAARSASSSRRKEELARRREEEEAAEESEVQPKVRRMRVRLDQRLTCWGERYVAHKP
jgi:hypothetical protein